MPTIDTTHINRPVWFDLSTSDLEAAKRLYGELFGWSFMDGGPAMGHYTMAFTPGGHAAAAIAPKMPDQGEMPTVWTVYFGTADMQESVRRITTQGGSIMVPPMHIPENGHMAIAVDPDGAVFGLWQAEPFPGAGVESEHGAMCWSEVNSRHAEANAKFYAGVFNLVAHALEMPDGEYYTLHDGNPAVCGVMQLDTKSEGIPPNWMPYFYVNNLDQANAIWEKHGGKIMAGPIASPYGNIMAVQDPQGAYLCYMSEG
ncbi:MAG: VOC family protein [Gemmatimonadaceae bacterium]|nr:VOC family protein [Gemmatimonadaceae bacterium]